eukprot:3735100-Rhodomonas_salina.1
MGERAGRRREHGPGGQALEHASVASPDLEAHAGQRELKARRRRAVRGGARPRLRELQHDARTLLRNKRVADGLPGVEIAV